MPPPLKSQRIYALFALLSCAGCGEPEGGGASLKSSVVFVEVAQEIGVVFTQSPGEHADFPLPASMGGGVALFDADSDGDLDIYLVNGHTAADGPIGATGEQGNALFLQGASGRFDDATATSGLGDRGYGMGAAVGDVDSDGDLDLYVSNLGLTTSTATKEEPASLTRPAALDSEMRAGDAPPPSSTMTPTET